MNIIAHRGASFDAPENTLASISLGWKQGADAVEIDVHYSKDGHVVVIHDDNTRKTAGVRRLVAEQPLAELKALDVGSWKSPVYAGERIPTLPEAFATVARGKRIFVEVKCGPECISQFARDVRSSGLKPKQIVPIGFSLETMQELKRVLPELEVCWIAEFKRTLRGWSPTAEKLIAAAKGVGLDGLDVCGRGPVNGEFVRKVHDAGMSLYIWTVDAPAKARALFTAGVDGITTNKPGWLRAALTSS